MRQGPAIAVVSPDLDDAVLTSAAVPATPMSTLLSDAGASVCADAVAAPAGLEDGAALAGGRVTAVVLTYNRRREATRCVERLRSLPERPPVLVVDNASTDGTARALGCVGDGVRVIRLERNVGAAGRNVGAARARTPYVALSDDDTWWAPGALSRAVAILDAHPRLALVTGRVLVGPEARLDPTCADMAASPLPPSPGVPGTTVLGFLAGASVVRRSAFLTAGGFEPRFFLGGGEELVAIDLVAAGWILAYVPGVVAHHHPSALGDAAARRRHLLRNALWFAWLRRPWPRAMETTARLGARALADPAARWALAHALWGAVWALRRRRALPRHVEAMLRTLEARRSR